MPISFNQSNHIQIKMELQKTLPDHLSPASLSSEPAEGIKLFLDMDGVLMILQKRVKNLTTK